MKKDITITAKLRHTRGKNEARRLRVQGLTPAVVYGAGNESVAVAVSPKEVTKILRSSTGQNTIFNLAVEEATTPVMIVDWQTDPIKENILHVDLKRIDLTKRIAVKIPIHTTGEPKGVKIQGGLLEAITREIEIECLADDIPDHFTVDVTELMIGQNLRASDVPMTGSMKLLSSPESVVAHVVALRAEEVAPAAEAAATPAAAAEPEVIKKGKKEEEAPVEEKKKK
ncbi:MAG TPA: 50S ribosomal protein L25 [Bryobacteraceae bacterium]|nr:50S ribosomal protein L25 [Bryobacteraceae bacterium]